MNKIELLKIPKSSKILITGHVNPDGDALGSGLALKLVFNDLGYSSTIAYDFPVKISDELSFLPISNLSSYDSKYLANVFDVAIVFDCGDSKRLGSLENLVNNSKSIYVIDHHLGQEFGTHQEVDSNAASTTQVLYRILYREKIEINPVVATCLLTGLITDTGRFQYPNTTEEVFDIASQLLKLGANLPLITESIYGSVNHNALKLQAEIITRIVLIKEFNLSFSYVLNDDYVKYNTKQEDTDFLIDVVRLPKESNVALLLKEQKDGIYKGSLRSRGEIDVQAIASSLGGGGHKAAAGFSTNLKREDILIKVTDAIRLQS